MTLTASKIAGLRPPETGIYGWHVDHLVPGFGLRVYSSTARKVWGIVRRWQGSKHPTFRKIGDYPDLGLADARARAREILADPGADPRVRRTAAPPEAPAEQQATAPTAPDTFGALAEAFLGHGRTKRGRELRASTTGEYRRALMTYAAGLHDRPVRDIRLVDVATLIDTVARERGATTAMRTRAALSRFWSWMVARGRVEANVVSSTEGFASQPRSRVLTDGELAAIWQATDDGTDFGLIVRVLLWTGCRRSEAGSMCWSELVDGTWTVPGSRTKNHRPLVLPLPRQALEALQAHPRIIGRNFVFGRGPAGFQAWSKGKERLDRKLGFARPWDLHDARRTVETRLRELGTSGEVVSRVLNHAMGPIEVAYNLHNYTTEKADALKMWAAQIEKITNHANNSNKVIDWRQR